jgi:outer membrane protein assembly factor BamB
VIPEIIMTRRFPWTCLCVVLPAVACAGAEDWPNFRGPRHDGVSRETGLTTAWDKPLPLIWEQNVGSSFSGLTCVQGRVYTCGTKQRKQVVYCLDADDGKVLWETPFEGEYVERQGGDGARATPTYDDGRLYVLGALGKLVCLKAADGSEVWSRQFKGPPKWGYSGSVLIEGDLAIISPGGSDGALTALNKKSGAPVWRCGGDGAGYATPYPFTFHGGRYIVGFMEGAALIADARDGREVWRMPWQTSWGVNAAAPIFHEGHLLLSSGYNHGAILLRMEPDGDRLKSEPVWENKVIRAKFQSPVLVDGHLYVSDEQRLKCVDFLTGALKWEHHRIGTRSVKDSTILAAQGHLFLLTEDGTLVIAKASSEAFEPTTQANILGDLCWTVPTIYKGRLYARDRSRLVCFGLTQ